MRKLLALALLTLSTAASAQFYSGNDLLERLNDPEREFFAMGYIAGVSDLGIREYHCPPQTVTLGQVRDMVHNSLNRDPSNRHMAASVLVTIILMERWPCANKKGSKL